MEDAQAAFRWVREEAPELGVDPERIRAPPGRDRSRRIGHHLRRALR